MSSAWWWILLSAAAAAVAESDSFWNTEGQLFPTLPIAVAYSEDERCRADSEFLMENLKKKTLWATTMWDSSAKSPVGILYGSIFHLGNFDECMRVVEPIKAQFCVAQVKAEIPAAGVTNSGNPYSLHTDPSASVWEKIRGSRIDPSKVPRDLINWGLCVPSSCSPEELEKGLNGYLNGTGYNVHVGDNFCTVADSGYDVTPSEIAFWSVAILLLVLTATSTVADCLRDGDEKDSTCRQLWMSFSAKRNVKKLLGSSDEASTGDKIDILHGIKAVSIISIVLGHRVGISLSLSSANFQEIEEHLRTGRALFFVHTDLVVDTFFFVSGLLACFFLMKVFAVRFVNPLLAILVRLMRLAPAYFFVIWYQASAANRLGSGPLWKAMAVEENRFCAENWWINVLFLSNYIKPKEMCMTHSWYIPCDLHFFILATCLVVLLVKQKKVGLALLSVLTIASAIVPALVTYVNQIQPMIIFYHGFLSRPRDDESFHTLYVKTHNRATVYLIGMTVGFFLFTYKDSVKRLSKKLTVSALFVWLLLMFAPMAYGSLYYNSERPYNAFEAAIFSSARRISWAIGFSIFVLVHRFGSVPILSGVLSSKPAVFLSNITYGIYLLHFNLISAEIFQTRSTVPFRIGDVLMNGVGDVILSGFFAVVLFLILEVPSKRIFREFVLGKRVNNRDSKNAKQPQTINNNHHHPHGCSVTVESSVDSCSKL